MRDFDITQDADKLPKPLQDVKTALAGDIELEDAEESLNDFDSVDTRVRNEDRGEGEGDGLQEDDESSSHTIDITSRSLEEEESSSIEGYEEEIQDIVQEERKGVEESIII